MLTSSETSGVSTWGFVIFFLILFWFFGGGVGFNRGFHEGCPHSDQMQAMHIQNCHQSERDVLDMARTIVEQNASTAKTLSEMAYAQEAQTAKILDGQKDLYIRDLERIATQQFITGQTSAITNRLDNLEAASALQRQADLASLNAQLAGIQGTMVKTPQFIPCGAMPASTCCNYGCGCNS